MRGVSPDLSMPRSTKHGVKNLRIKRRNQVETELKLYPTAALYERVQSTISPAYLMSPLDKNQRSEGTHLTRARIDTAESSDFHNLQRY